MANGNPFKQKSSAAKIGANSKLRSKVNVPKARQPVGSRSQFIHNKPLPQSVGGPQRTPSVEAIARRMGGAPPSMPGPGMNPPGMPLPGGGPGGPGLGGLSGPGNPMIAALLKKLPL